MNGDSLALASLAASPKEDEDAIAPLGSSSLAVEAVRETGARAGEYEVVEYETKGDKEVVPDGEYAADRFLPGPRRIGNVAGGRPIKRRGRGVGSVARPTEKLGKLVNATAQLPASASQHNTTAQDFTSVTRAQCLPSDALSPADQIMPQWIVLVDCRASGHIWKSRQYIWNALGSAVHVTAT